MVASSRPFTPCTRSPSPTDGSSARRATRSSSPSCAPRRSRSRRFRSSARGPTSATVRSRSRARRTWRCPSSSTPCVRSSPPPRRPKSELETGPAPTPIEHNCSGKHAGFLAVCRTRGLETRGYRFGRPPAAARSSWWRSPRPPASPPADVPVAVDGCGVPTFAFTLERSRTAVRPAAASRRRRHASSPRCAPIPELLRGPVAADVKLIRTLPGWVGEGRGGRALLRVFRGRAGRRAQGRGRLLPSDSPCTCEHFSNRSGSSRASSASSRWRTATANVSGR